MSEFKVGDRVKVTLPGEEYLVVIGAIIGIVEETEYTTFSEGGKITQVAEKSYYDVLVESDLGGILHCSPRQLERIMYLHEKLVVGDRVIVNNGCPHKGLRGLRGVVGKILEGTDILLLESCGESLGLHKSYVDVISELPQIQKNELVKHVLKYGTVSEVDDDFVVQVPLRTLVNKEFLMSLINIGLEIADLERGTTDQS